MMRIRKIMKMAPRVNTAIRVLLLMLCLAVVACGCELQLPGTDKDKIMIYPAMVEMPAGETLLLRIKNAPDGNEDMDISWRSSDNQIASVSENGYVTAISGGEAIVEAVPNANKGHNGTCRIVVKEDGPILLFPVDKEDEDEDDTQTSNPPGIGAPQGEPEQPEPPDTPDDSQGESEQGNPDDEIPVEHDPELDIPVEENPKIDEFIWTIRINDTIEKDVGDFEIPMKAIYKLKLNVTKEGGKTSKGVYKGDATIEVKIDASELSEKVIDKSENTIIKFLINIGGTYTAENLTIIVEAYDGGKYANYGRDPGSGPGIVPLVPKSGMACGYTLFEGSGNFGVSTLDIVGIGINNDASGLGSQEFSIYKMGIGSAGEVNFDLMELQVNKSFKGRISKKPIIPK